VLFGQLIVRPEHRPAFLAALMEDARGSREDEPGCLRFDVAVDTSNPNRFLLFEEFVDDAAVDAHRAAPHFQPIRVGLPQWLALPSITDVASRVEPG
jgi:quinol monooxygenase YgiN